MRNKTKIVLLILITFVLIYSPFVVCYLDLSSIFSNLFFRVIEFCIGVIIALMKDIFDKTDIAKRHVYNWKFISLIRVLRIFGVALAVRLHIAVGNYMLDSWICLPCFIALIIALNRVPFHSIGISSNRILLYLSDMTYCFFWVQLFSNKISKVVINQYKQRYVDYSCWLVCVHGNYSSFA